MNVFVELGIYLWYFPEFSGDSIFSIPRGVKEEMNMFWFCSYLNIKLVILVIQHLWSMGVQNLNHGKEREGPKIALNIFVDIQKHIYNWGMTEQLSAFFRLFSVWQKFGRIASGVISSW